MYFYKNINIIEINQPHIIIRLHPSENKSKYDWFINKNSKTISLSENDDLLTDVMKSSIVVGCNTMAMVVGLIAGKRVICSIPRGGKKCVLPHKNIEHLQIMISNTKQV